MHLRLLLLISLCVLALAGLPGRQAAGGVSLSIIHPLDGQVLYAGEPAPRYVVPVSGRASSADGSLAAYTLQVEVYHQQRLLSSYRGMTEATGDFEIMVTVNPDAAVMGVPPERYYCRECHDTPADLTFADGDNTVVISVTGAQGEQAVQQRRVFVDHSGYVDLLALIQAGVDGPADLSGVPVVAKTEFPVTANSAATVQTREFRALADASGRARLQVETLRSQALHYRLSIPPTASGGRLLASAVDGELTVPAYAREAATVPLVVQSTVGGITGAVSKSPAVSGQPVVRAVSVADGTSYAAPAGEGDYSLPGLAPDRYRVALFGGSAGTVLLSRVHEVDLTQAGQVALNLQTAGDMAGEVHGTVRGVGGDAVPFAWVSLAGSNDTVRTNPADGAFALARPSAGAPAVSIVAPGYWSKLQVITKGAASDVALIPRPDLRRLPLPGDGQLTLPAETLANMDDNSLTLHAGWVWMYTGAAGWRVTVGETAIEVAENSRIAVEAPAGRSGRLYVWSGRATLHSDACRQDVLVEAGHMAVLPARPGQIAALRALPVDAGALALLTAGDGAAPAFAGEPSLAAQISNGLARAGVGAAQVVTLAGYLLLILGAGAGLLVLLARLRR